jgi:hypothetical protein
MTETAQSAFKRLLRDVVSPALREQGLRGSGSVYVLPHPAYWAQVGFQRSTSSSKDAVKFTINLKVTNKEWWNEQRRDHSPLKDRPPPGVDRAAWDAQRLEHSVYPARPSVNTSDDGRWQRIGDLIPGIDRDHWWMLTVENAQEVMQDALGALLSYGVPWLRRET